MEGGGGFQPSTFDRARRRRRVRSLARSLRDEDTQELLPLDEVSRRLRVFQQHDAGVRTIPLDAIVGTVDRVKDFDRDFLPRRSEIGERWRRVEGAFPEGDFPPIQVYEVDGRYFLVDGHHRVAIARQRGADFIEAEVIELRTRFPLPPDADIGQIVHTERERVFMQESGLERARPEAKIELTRPHGYLELLEQVKVHGYDLMEGRGEVLPPEEVAGHWFDTVYLPAVEAIRRTGLDEVAPEATEGDLYLTMHQRRLSMLPEAERDVSADDAAAAVRDAELRRSRGGRTRRAVGRLRPRRRPGDGPAS
jgi:hypothetical protein